MTDSLALIGFGEAAQAFAGACGWGAARAFDTASARAADMARLSVAACDTAAEALGGASLVLSLVTADQALAAARNDARFVAPGALWCDMNSVAPDTKRAAAAAIQGAGGRYVDVAVMAPVHPLRSAVPLLLSGDAAADAAQALTAIGFGNVRVVAGGVGAASSIKMIRSVIVKGIEALTVEAMLAAARAGVADAVLGSLGDGWDVRADYNLDRMLVHGTRRAAEMDEVVATLESLGVDPLMSRGTAARQRAIGALRAGAPAGLAAKLALIDPDAARPDLESRAA